MQPACTHAVVSALALYLPDTSQLHAQLSVQCGCADTRSVLLRLCRVLMSKLQELAAASLSLGLPGDPLSQVCARRVTLGSALFCAYDGDTAVSRHSLSCKHANHARPLQPGC